MHVLIFVLALVAAVAADGYGYAPAPYKQSYHQPSYKQSYKPSYKPSYHKPSYKPSYHQPSYKPSHDSYHEPSYGYVPVQYSYYIYPHGHYGDHASVYVDRQPYSVHYDINEYGPYGSTQYVNFNQEFGHGYKQPSYKGYH